MTGGWTASPFGRGVGTSQPLDSFVNVHDAGENADPRRQPVQLEGIHHSMCITAETYPQEA
jgi:hypothetical protein